MWIWRKIKEKRFWKWWFTHSHWVSLRRRERKRKEKKIFPFRSFCWWHQYEIIFLMKNQNSFVSSVVKMNSTLRENIWKNLSFNCRSNFCLGCNYILHIVHKCCKKIYFKISTLKEMYKVDICQSTNK